MPPFANENQLHFKAFSISQFNYNKNKRSSQCDYERKSKHSKCSYTCGPVKIYAQNYLQARLSEVNRQ